MKWRFDGTRVKKRREELGLKQYHMTVKFGINQSQLARIETDAVKPNTKLLCQLAEALDVSPSYFFIAMPD